MVAAGYSFSQVECSSSRDQPYSKGIFMLCSYIHGQRAIGGMVAALLFYKICMTERIASGGAASLFVLFVWKLPS